MASTTLIIAITLFLFSCTFLVFHFKQTWNALNSYKWVMTEGTIINKQIEIIHDKKRDESLHRFDISYKYQINEQTYQSNQLYFGDKTYKGGDGSKHDFAKLEANSKVNIHYNPKQPSSAVLQKGLRTELKISLSFGIIILISSSCLILNCCIN